MCLGLSLVLCSLRCDNTLSKVVDWNEADSCCKTKFITYNICKPIVNNFDPIVKLVVVITWKDCAILPVGADT